MNKIPNPNYPLPEKWYIQRTLENAVELNKLCNHIFPGKNYSYGTKESDYDEIGYSARHFIHRDKGNRKKPLEGYTEVTYEDLWLAYVISEKWYCVDIKSEDFVRWEKINNYPVNTRSSRYLVLSKHIKDRSYYWGGHVESLKRHESYKDYEEISKETYLKLLDILEQKKNSNKMENKTEIRPTEVIIPLVEFKKIVDVACTDWQGRLKAHILENLQNDCISVKVTKGFYNQMIEASAIRNGVNQVDIINSVLPMFKHDPYKVFKDAEKEGKIVQVLGNDNKWITKEERGLKHWNYDTSPEKYRIKHKHQDLIDEWEASGRTKEVEYYCILTEKWLIVDYPSWYEHLKYRLKPEPKYVPFTFEDAEFLIGKTIKSKDNTVIMTLNYFGRNTGVSVDGTMQSFQFLLDYYTFLDGTPCGKLVTG